MLAPIPALLGTLINLYHCIHPPPRSEFNCSTRADYLAAAAWVCLRSVRSRLGLNKVWQSILTGVQCLYFTTGLLTRWKAYYPLLPTLIRLLGLQAICWPATHYTHVFLQYDGHNRPLLCWTVIGTTTCVSCSLSPPLFLPHASIFSGHPLHPNVGHFEHLGMGPSKPPEPSYWKPDRHYRLGRKEQRKMARTQVGLERGHLEMRAPRRRVLFYCFLGNAHLEGVV